MTDFCYDPVAPTSTSSTTSTSTSIASSASVLQQATRRAEEWARQRPESSKPSAYSNFLLSAVTSLGCHGAGSGSGSRGASCSPRRPAAPHLHNHCSRGADSSPHREGENFATITGTFKCSHSLTTPYVLRNVLSYAADNAAVLLLQPRAPTTCRLRTIAPTFRAEAPPRPAPRSSPGQPRAALYSACSPRRRACPLLPPSLAPPHMQLQASVSASSALCPELPLSASRQPAPCAAWPLQTPSSATTPRPRWTRTRCRLLPALIPSLIH